MDHDEEVNQPRPKKEVAEELFWDGYEYEFWEKTSDWFWILGTIAALVIVIAFMLGNYLLAVIILLGAFILGTQAKRLPNIITYGLAKTGVKHGETIFRYDTIRSFWVDGPRNQLVIESGRMVKPHIYIPLADTNPEQVRALLLPIIKEQEYHGSFGDFVTEFFGF